MGNHKVLQSATFLCPGCDLDASASKVEKKDEGTSIVLAHPQPHCDAFKNAVQGTATETNMPLGQYIRDGQKKTVDAGKVVIVHES